MTFTSLETVQQYANLALDVYYDYVSLENSRAGIIGPDWERLGSLVT